MNDEELLEATLSRLKSDGLLEYTGEYGGEITTFIPFVAWLKREGYLKGRKIRSYAGMRPYYFFLDDEEWEEKPEERIWVVDHERYWPSHSTYTATKSRWHVYSDFRAHYAKSHWQFDKPVLFLQNKFAVEWNIGPINYFPLNVLRAVFKNAEEKYDVVYSRPTGSPKGFSKDFSTFCSYPDRAVLEEFPHVLDFEKCCQENHLDYNRAKLEICARAHHFMAVQGGGAHILAAFGDSRLLILDHQSGTSAEFPHAYAQGPYKYLAAAPPDLMVARDYFTFRAAAVQFCKLPLRWGIRGRRYPEKLKGLLL